MSRGQDSGLGLDSLPDLPEKRYSNRKFIRESWQPSHRYHASMASLLNFIQTKEFHAPEDVSQRLPPVLSSESSSHEEPTSIDGQPGGDAVQESEPGWELEPGPEPGPEPEPERQPEPEPEIPVPGPAAIDMPSILERPEIQMLIQEFQPTARKYTANPALAQELHFAIDRKDENTVFQLLRHGVDPNIRHGRSGASPLHRAFGVNSFEIAVFLILAGARLEKQNKAGETALIRAVRCEFPDDIIAMVCELGANINAIDCTGRSALHYAADFVASDDNTILALVGYGADVDLRDDEGRTPLHIAAAGGRLKAVQQLVGYGADIETRLPNGKTALYMAVSKKNAQIARFLCESGANLNDKYADATPLTLAIRAGNEEVAQLLVDQGANVNFRDAKGEFPLLSAATAGSEKLTRLLLSQGADLNMVSSTKSSPLHKAAKKGFMDVVRALVDAGVPVDRVNSSGASPLLLAVREGHEGVVRHLLESGANPELAPDNLSILWHAIETEHPEIAIILLEDKRVNTMRVLDKHGTTPFHHAAAKGLDEVVDRILRRGALVDTRDLVGRTPFFYAVEAGRLSTARLLQHMWFADVTARTSADDTVLFACGSHPEVLRFLLGLKEGRHGAVSPKGWSLGKSRPALDVNHRNEEGATALHHAAAAGELESVKMLLQKGARQFSAAEVVIGRGREALVLQGTPADVARQLSHTEVASFLEKWAARHK